PDRPAGRQAAGADLRAAEVLEHGDLPPRPLRRRADSRVGVALRLLRAVREVETEDVGAGGNQRVEHVVGAARRADRRHDLGVSHRLPHRAAVARRLEYRAMGIIVPDAIERYLAGLNRAADAVLDEIARGNAQRGLPLVDAEVGALLRALATAVSATRILE